MEPLKRGLSLFNFCCILYILLRAHHGCLNSRYFRNSHRDWNSTFYARVHCLQGLSFITKIHLKICGRSESLDCVGRFDYTPTRSLLFGDSWARLLNGCNEVFEEDRDLPWVSHNLLQILCSSPVQRAQWVFHPGQRYVYIYNIYKPSVSSLCPQPLPVLKLIQTLYTDTVIHVPTAKRW